MDNSTQAMSLCCSEKRCVIHINKAFSNIVGYSKTELVGKNLKILQGEETNQEVINTLRQTIINGKMFEGQVWNYKKNKQKFIMQWIILKIYLTDGEFFLGFHNDVTLDVNNVKKLETSLSLLRLFSQKLDWTLVKK